MEFEPLKAVEFSRDSFFGLLIYLKVFRSSR